MQTTCWYSTGGGIEKRSLKRPLWIAPQGGLAKQMLPGVPVVVPLAGRDEAIAALLVPAACEQRVSVNGVPSPAGLRLLRDRVRLEFQNHAFWLSAECVAEQADYDPARHGRDVFCFMTKARLRDGEPVTICPGRPGAACGTIYKRAAWETLISQPGGFRCPNCSFDPQSPVWKPTLPPARRSLANLIRLVRQEAAR